MGDGVETEVEDVINDFVVPEEGLKVEVGEVGDGTAVDSVRSDKGVNM